MRPLRAFVLMALLGWFGAWMTNGPVATAPHTAPLVITVPATTTTVAPPPTTTTTTARVVLAAPPRPPRASRAATAPRQAPVYAEIDGMPGLLRRIGGCESSGAGPTGAINWTAQNRTSSASGGFQILDSTWAGWVKAYAPDLVGKYAKARLAPPEDQLRVARAAFERQGTGPWKASRGCWA